MPPALSAGSRPTRSSPSSHDEGDVTSSFSAPGRGRPIKSIACRRCHSRKVKCSGGLPCENCLQASRESECSYPRRSRQVKVDQRYIDDLIRENQQLRAAAQEQGRRTEPPGRSSGSAAQNGVTSSSCKDKSAAAAAAAAAAAEPEANAPGPLLAEGPWFFNLNIPHTPILIGETSDAGFATRFRQAIATSSEQKSHIPRTNYPSDERLLTLYDTDCPWPSVVRARLLVRVALKHVSENYHIVRRSETLQGLESTLQNPQLSDSFFKAKLWALFAIGEMYSTRTTSTSDDFPGMRYFVRATRILRIVSERPRLDAIEIRLLLSLYSLAMNRRHSAYFLAGSAARLSVVMGMHLNVPETYLSDPAIREHRNRVWWTAYSFDRMWAINLSNPVAVPEDAIDVDLPSSAVDSEDFGDPAYYIARIGLARLSGRIAWSIYGIKRDASLSSRVQEALKDLREWDEQLPTHLRLASIATGERHPNAETLRLNFNQCVICATRPIVLHVLRVHVASWTEPRSEPKVPASAVTLAEACIRCARQSIRLLMECWVDGSFATFDYFYAQDLFSAATILAISSLLDWKESHSDSEQFEAALQVLSQLKESGHLAAEEFYRHARAYRAAMANQLERKKGLTAGADADLTAPGAPSIDGSSMLVETSSTSGTMPLMEASLQELLTQPALDLQFMDQSLYQDSPQGLYWPEMYTEGWMNDTWVPS